MWILWALLLPMNCYSLCWAIRCWRVQYDGDLGGTIVFLVFSAGNVIGNGVALFWYFK